MSWRAEAKPPPRPFSLEEIPAIAIERGWKT
jgi:hypothetical protein